MIFWKVLKLRRSPSEQNGRERISKERFISPGRRHVPVTSSRDRLTRTTDRARSSDYPRIRRQYTIAVENEQGHQSPPTEGPGALWSHSQRPRCRRTRLRACKRALQSRERTSYRRSVSAWCRVNSRRTISSDKNRQKFQGDFAIRCL